jgi:hypothetical protein
MDVSKIVYTPKYYVLSPFQNKKFKSSHGGKNLEFLPLDYETGNVNHLRSLERWDCGFESHSRHGCRYAFILCLCCSVYR